jgi:hypothetical protein
LIHKTYREVGREGRPGGRSRRGASAPSHLPAPRTRRSRRVDPRQAACQRQEEEAAGVDLRSRHSPALLLGRSTLAPRRVPTARWPRGGLVPAPRRVPTARWRPRRPCAHAALGPNCSPAPVAASCPRRGGSVESERGGDLGGGLGSSNVFLLEERERTERGREESRTLVLS